MSDCQAVRLDGTRVSIATKEIAELRSAVRRLVRPGDAGYEEARRVWNGMIDRRPALIAECAEAAQVQSAVRFAGRHRLLLAVRGGGHNVAGYATCEGGLVIDLSPMHRVEVDPDRRTARVGGGATWGDVDTATQAHGQVVPGGIVSTTGVAGLTLGGGQGWLRRTFGMTSDNLLAAEVVTAEGDLVTASDDENRELFWALRGGGGNFGIVTTFEFRTHPVGPTVAFAGPCFAVEDAVPVMHAMRAYVADAPDEVNVSTTWWTIPPVETFPRAAHGRTVITIGAIHAGDPEIGEAGLRPLREIGTPVLDLSGPLPYVALQTMFDAFFPAHDLLYYWKSLYLEELGDEAVRALAEHVAARPSHTSMVGTWALGGALGRIDPSASASGGRGAPFLVEILANWQDAAESEANIAWARRLFDAMRPYGSGKTNLNFPGLGDEPEFTRAALAEHWDRLVAVKRRYDPDNLFRLNQNIAP